MRILFWVCRLRGLVEGYCLLRGAVWGTTERMSCSVVRRSGFFLAFVFLACMPSIVVALGRPAQTGAPDGQATSGQATAGQATAGQAAAGRAPAGKTSPSQGAGGGQEPAAIPEVPANVKPQTVMPQTVTPDEGEKKPDYSKEGYRHRAIAIALPFRERWHRAAGDICAGAGTE